MSKFAILFLMSTILMLGSCTSVKRASYNPGYTSTYSTSYIRYRPTYWGYRTAYYPGYRYRYIRYNRYNRYRRYTRYRFRITRWRRW